MFRELPVAFQGFGRQADGRFEPCPEIVADREPGGRDIGTVLGRGDKLGEFGFCLSFRASECLIGRPSLAREWIAAKVEFEAPRLFATADDATFDFCLSSN